MNYVKSNGPYLRPSKSSQDPGSCNEIWIFVPIQQGCWENLIMFFFGYWATILDCDSAVLKKVKKISMTSNVLPLHFAPSQASSGQNSNVDNF